MLTSNEYVAQHYCWHAFAVTQVIIMSGNYEIRDFESPLPRFVTLLKIMLGRNIDNVDTINTPTRISVTK